MHLYKYNDTEKQRDNYKESKIERQTDEPRNERIQNDIHTQQQPDIFEQKPIYPMLKVCITYVDYDYKRTISARKISAAQSSMF